MMAPERQCRRESHSCVLAPFYFVVAAKLVSDGVLRGLGKMRQFMTATFTNLILRVVLAFGLSKLWGGDRHLALLANRMERCNGDVPFLL